MAFTVKDVQSLREKTGCGMMDCKKALTDSDGNMEAAVEILREKGLAAAEKRSGRIAAEGIVVAMVEDNVGVMVEVNSETDFVAKNESFVEYAQTVAKTIIAENPADLDALLSTTAFGLGMTVEESLREKILVIGENLKIRRFERIEGDVVAYVHGGGRIGVLVGMENSGGAAGSEIAHSAGRDVAMQIAALNASYLSKEAVPADVMEREKEILMIQIKSDESNSNKPDNIIEKMVLGRMGKYYKSNCLLEQEFVKNPDLNVAQYLAEKGKEAGGTIEISSFVRYERGEGLEKRSDNFADEVANMIK